MTLLFLHGSGCTHVVWQYQQQFFEHSIAVDYPGHPDGQTLNNVDELALWLADYIARHQLVDVVLVGHSLGSAVAMQLAIIAQENLKALVLIGAGARLKVMPQLLASLTTIVDSKQPFPDYLLATNQNIAEPLQSQINTSIINNGVSVMLNDFTLCNKFDVIEQLPQIDVPTLIIVGDEDQMTPIKYATFLQQHISKAQIVIIEKGTHMVFAEQPDKVNHCIETFLKTLE
ncbi:alpha/beta fold hydrolase [Shewanella ulleungensis]|jgi:pimeloyl-ACP methyl ester carboxylesterase|uniref:Alpha/beta hydrolase n=1 Tax=Shewanella ulleungensis TaxID=2282699 RepID=A0ABQ2QHE8_9GAMM|nr:alpha/beta hydrolase [Shewanella ulleungensis]MCL1152280.1 alpha/beta hydrolase [Shewanella ulleungensis]GGP82105.1 alpha/beta hydrolase [Shewanella ulleungensis]